jgi:hypothetical protein
MDASRFEETASLPDGLLWSVSKNVTRSEETRTIAIAFLARRRTIASAEESRRKLSTALPTKLSDD